MELLPNYKKPTVTLVMTHSDQATHRAIRTLGDYTHHSGTFVATEGELLAGDHESSVWQICGTGMNNNPPVEIDPNITLAEIITGIDRLLETSSYTALPPETSLQTQTLSIPLPGGPPCQSRRSS